MGFPNRLAESLDSWIGGPIGSPKLSSWTSTFAAFAGYGAARENAPNSTAESLGNSGSAVSTSFSGRSRSVSGISPKRRHLRNNPHHRAAQWAATWSSALIFRGLLLALGFHAISPQGHDHAQHARDHHRPRANCVGDNQDAKSNSDAQSRKPDRNFAGRPPSPTNHWSDALFHSTSIEVLTRGYR